MIRHQSSMGVHLTKLPALGEHQRAFALEDFPNPEQGRGLAVSSGWYSRGAFAMAVQYSEVQRFWSDDKHTSAALLLGARTSGKRVFLVGGVGPAAARSVTDCNGACQVHSVGQPLALGFSGQAVVNTPIVGLTLGTFGALGERRVSYAGIGLSVAVEWFGK